MIGMSGVGDGLEQFVEAGDATAVLERPVPFATNVAWIRDAGLTDADIGYGEPMFPAIPEVVSVINDGFSRLSQTLTLPMNCPPGL